MALPISLTPAGGATADGNYPSIAGIEVRGSLLWSAWGAFGAGTAKLQFSPDDGTTWTDITGASWTAAFALQQVNFPAGGRVRMNLAGSTGATLSVAGGAVPA